MKCRIYIDGKTYKFVDMTVEIGDRCQLCNKSIYYNFNDCEESNDGHVFARFYATLEDYTSDYQRDRAIRADTEQMQREDDEYWMKVQSGEIKRNL